jgi:hypothetical protein
MPFATHAATARPSGERLFQPNADESQVVGIEPVERFGGSCNDTTG